MNLFQGVLCLFLLEMGMTASRKLKDLKAGGPGFIAFALIAPNLFATFGIIVAHTYAHLTHTPFQLGSYVLFSVLCAAASYIAVPAVQRLAIPEASPTLPLAASLGLTFSYNVTIGIPIYIVIAQQVMRAFPYHLKSHCNRGPPRGGPRSFGGINTMKSHTEYLTFNVPARMDFINITRRSKRSSVRVGFRKGCFLQRHAHHRECFH